MPVEVRPLGIKCNMACRYCYQNLLRDAGNQSKWYDLEKIKKSISEQGGPFVLFGGEPLLVDETDLEELWSWGLNNYNLNAIQTNGTLINENHIRMFKQYKVHVGISIDGPGALNDIRWVHNLEKTRANTTKTEHIIERLCSESIPPSLIVTLHRNNATQDKLPIMHDWFRYLEKLGVSDIRFHILETENIIIKQKYALTTQEYINALISFATLEKELINLKFDIFNDIENLLVGHDQFVTCVWRACDPYTTVAVHGIEGYGQSSNCGRTNKNGIDYPKADRPGYERYLSLYNTPQENGGCQGCRFFMMCKGQCPGTAIDNDWRNRTQDCETWKQLFIHVETCLVDQGVKTISLDPNLKYLEAAIIQSWKFGNNPTIQLTLETMRKQVEEANSFVSN